MNFKFHGDSHYWCWGHRMAPSFVGFRSNHVNKLLGPSPYAHHDNGSNYLPGKDGWDNIPIIEMFLEKLGHRVSTTCSPGNDFNSTVRTIQEDKVDPTIDYNVVFYSMDLRGDKLNDLLMYQGTDGYDEWVKKYNAITVSHLDRLGKYANEVGQKYLLIGGQGTLFQEVFDQCSFKQNLYLVSECLFYSIFNREDNAEKLVFKLADLPFSDQALHVRSQGKATTAAHDLPNYHPELITKIWEDMNRFDGMFGVRLYPDKHHLNASEVIFLLDILFGYIEENFGPLDK